MADMTCEHGHLLGACEDCAYEAARAAGRACPALLRRRRADDARGWLAPPTLDATGTDTPRAPKRVTRKS